MYSSTLVPRRRLAAVGLALAGLLAAGCAATPPAVSQPPACPDGGQGVTTTFAHATNVSITGAGGYRVLTVHEPFPGGVAESFVLAGCGEPLAELPAELVSAPVIDVPVTSVYAESTTQLPLMDDLGVLDALTGVGTPDFVSGAAARARIDAGEVTGFATSGQVDAETVLGGAPDVLLGQGVDSPAYPALRQAGIPVVGWADYLESGPLAQAEWIKVMGALTGRGAEAARVFDEIESRYASVASAVAGREPTPVLVGQLYEGVWPVPAGGSTTGTLLRDAGATWSEAANPETSSVVKDFETVYAQDGAAPVWLADGPFASGADVPAADGRYATLTAAAAGGLWTRDAALGPTGGNEYYERGVTRPDEVLADLVAILHPDALPGHSPHYFRPVSSRPAGT